MTPRMKLRSICRNCKKVFHPIYSSYGYYCSLNCQKEYEYAQRIRKWFDGEINPMVPTNGLLRPWARRYIFKKFKSRCVLCGWSKLNKSTGKIPLEIDHIDGNYRNNKVENLRLLCPNCHSLTGTYKKLNSGKGRNGRK